MAGRKENKDLKNLTEMLSEKNMEGSLLSPVSSPAPQAKQHTSTNLTGDPRKVKDLAADFHNLMMKWKSLNSEGMNIISRLANIKIEKVFNVKEQDGDAATTGLPLELNPLCDQLCLTIENMSKVEAKMQYKVKIAEGLESLQQFQKLSVASSLFSTMTLHDVAITLAIIHRDFEEELKFKKELCRQIAHADSRELLMFFCEAWVHQPYYQPKCQDLLQALLVETGHVK